MRAKLTKRLLDQVLKEHAGKALLVWDQEVRGLVFRLRKDGAPGFVYKYKLRGRQRELAMGAYGALTLDKARDRARDLYAIVKAGGDPVLERQDERRRRATFEEAAKLYLADLQERAETGAARGRLSTIAEFKRALERRILPRLGRLEVEAVALEHVEAWHRSLAATPAGANRALTVVSAVLSFAERRKLRPAGTNPCPLVTRFREQPKQARLSLEQLAALGEAMRQAESAGKAHPSALLAIRLLALTGMRRSEVAGHGQKARRADGDALVWSDVDLEGRAINLRNAKAGARAVPLGSAAVELLRAARPADSPPGALVCPGERAGQAFIGLDKVQRALFARAGINGASLHALRRTFASVAADAGLGEYIIAGLLGHRSGSVTGRYVHPDRDPLFQAAELVSGTIAAALLGRPPAAVVEISTRRPQAAS